MRRAVLQARLASERANLLYELRGLDEGRLCIAPVHDGWTVRDILPHLGYWDAAIAGRLEKLIGERPEAIQRPSDHEALDQLNAEVRHTFTHLDLGQAMAVAVKERNGLLATLARTPDDLLFSRIYLGDGWRVSPSTWVRSRYQHDAEHAADIKHWRSSLRTNQSPKPAASKVILRPFLAASRRELMALAGLIPASKRHTQPVCGAWMLNDVLGHLTLYEAMGVSALRDLAAGNQPQIDKTIRNFDTFNEAQVLARRPVGWEEALEAYRAVRKMSTTLLDSLTDADLMQPFMAPWGAPVNGYQYVFGLGIHEQEHAAILRRALGLTALPRRLRHYRPA